MAFCASSGELMVTKAKPRGRPVVRSVTRLASTTVPWAAKASWRSFSVTLKSRFPTNNLVLIICCAVLDSSALATMFPHAGSQILIEPGSLEDLHVMEVKNVSRDWMSVLDFGEIASAAKNAAPS